MSQVKIEAENERMLETAATLFGSKPVAEIQHICKGWTHFVINKFWGCLKRKKSNLALELFICGLYDKTLTSQETMEGHQRAIMGTMTVEQLYRDRKTFADRVFEIAKANLYRLTNRAWDEGYLKVRTVFTRAFSWPGWKPLKVLSHSSPSRGLFRDCEIFANLRSQLYCPHPQQCLFYEIVSWQIFIVTPNNPLYPPPANKQDTFINYWDSVSPHDANSNVINILWPP